MPCDALTGAECRLIQPCTAGGLHICSLQHCLQRASDAESQLLEEQGKVMKLEVTVAEQQQQLGRMEDLTKELNHHRSAS